MKSWSVIDRLVAKRAPTSTRALAPKSTPFWLEMKSWPLALRLPKILDGSPPTSRNNAMDEAPGCDRFTLALAPIENEPNSAIIFCVYWSICRRVPCGAWIWPAPLVIWPPVGSVFGSGAWAWVVCGRYQGRKAVATASARARGRAAAFTVLLRVRVAMVLPLLLTVMPHQPV